MEQSVEKIIERNLLEVCVLNPWAGTISTWRRSPSLVLWTAR